MRSTTQAPFAAPAPPPIPQHVFTNCSNYLWSPKLNGHRALLSLRTGKLTSRKGRDLTHIMPRDVKIPLAVLAAGIQALEGEIVVVRNERVLDDVDLVTSLVASKSADLLRFYVFDADGPQPFQERIQIVAKSLTSQSFIRCIPQFHPFVASLNDVRAFCLPTMNKLPMAYEGIVVRLATAGYQNPQMYKMTFPRSKVQVRARLVRIESDYKSATVRFKDQEQTFHLSQKAMKVFRSLVPLVSSLNDDMEVVVDISKKVIVGVGTDWL